jgi:hypothetical protein
MLFPDGREKPCSVTRKTLPITENLLYLSILTRFAHPDRQRNLVRKNRGGSGLAAEFRSPFISLALGIVFIANW